MNKSDLIANLKKEYPFLTLAQVEELVDLTFKKITDSLADQKRIEIRDFGSFSTKQIKVQSSFYDSVNKAMQFEQKNAVSFKIGKDFFDRLNS